MGSSGICVGVDCLYIARLKNGGLVKESVSMFDSTTKEIMQERYGMSPDRYTVLRIKG